MPPKQTSGPRLIAEVVEDLLATLDGRARLDAFYRLPPAMQRGAWAALRREVERERERAA